MRHRLPRSLTVGSESVSLFLSFVNKASLHTLDLLVDLCVKLVVLVVKVSVNHSLAFRLVLSAYLYSRQLYLIVVVSFKDFVAHFLD